MNRLKGWPWWAYIALAGAIAVLLWLGHWMLVGRADKAAADAAQAKTGQVVGEQRGAAAVDAGKVIERHYETTREIERIRDAGLADIRAAQSDGDAGNAARRALCLLDKASYGEHPACKLP